MKFSLLILFSLTLIMCNNQNDIVDDLPVEAQFKSIQYKELPGVKEDLLSLDIYYKSNVQEPMPVVIFVHGGAWSIGDKRQKLENKINFFQAEDYVFVSVNYRLSPFPYDKTNENRVKFPAHSEDVADAIKWVHDNIGNYGGDANKIALIGHSAGAHLVSLIGTNQSFLNDVGLDISDIKGVASIDTEGYDVLAKVKENVNFYINAFGSDKDLNIEASPIYNVQAGIEYPKFFIAKRGDQDRLGIANSFIDKLQENGVEVTQIDASIYSHIGINNAIGEPGESLITGALQQFFENCFN